MAKHNIFISGDITPFSFWEEDYTIKNLNEDLSALTVSENDELIVDINTFGGDTETGFAMYNMLKRFGKENSISITTRTTGYCASIGVVILLAGSKRIGNYFNTPFTHNAWTSIKGDAEELKRVAEDLENTNNKIAQIYADETNIDVETALQLMNKDAFIDADKVLEYGFYTEIENASVNQIFNSINKYRMSDKGNTNSMIMDIWNKHFAKNKAKVIYTADNKEVNFFELNDGDDLKQGDRAKIGDDLPDGEILMSNGETLVFNKGVYKETKEAETKEDIQALKNQIQTLENEKQTLQNSIDEKDVEIRKYVQFKNEVMNIKVEAPEKEPVKAPTTTENKKPTTERTFNLNPKK